MPKLERILETVLYVKDLERAAAFYEEFMELPVLFTDQRMRAFDVGGNGTLLLFITGQSLRPVETPMGTIPPHDGDGPAHIAFSITKTELGAWEKHLDKGGISVESRMEWPRGGISIYFRDPDDHLIELATPGLWKGY